MKVYRYMSFKEFNTMILGIPVVHKKRAFKARTNSYGFCFLPETTKFSVYEDDYSNKKHDFFYSAEQCYEFLSGIVSNDILVEFEVLDESILSEGYGIYADPTYISGWWGTIGIIEYSTIQYDWTTLRPLRAKIPNETWGPKNEWFDLHVDMEDVEMMRELLVMEQLEELAE